MRPPDISSTLAFQLRNIVWKMSLPAQPDWIFQVIASAAGATEAATVAAAEPPRVGEAVGAFCDRHDVTNAAETRERSVLEEPATRELRKKTHCVVHLLAIAPRRAHSILVLSTCQVTGFVRRESVATAHLLYVDGGKRVSGRRQRSGAHPRGTPAPRDGTSRRPAPR
jgi:hypothetical protein